MKQVAPRAVRGAPDDRRRRADPPVRGDVHYWGSLMAACLIASLPIAVVYNVFLDRFIAGFTVDPVK